MVLGPVAAALLYQGLATAPWCSLSCYLATAVRSRAFSEKPPESSWRIEEHRAASSLYRDRLAALEFTYGITDFISGQGKAVRRGLERKLCSPAKGLGEVAVYGFKVLRNAKKMAVFRTYTNRIPSLLRGKDLTILARLVAPS